MECHPSLSHLCLWFFFLTHVCHQYLGCVDEERAALLELNALALRFKTPLPTWVHDQTIDCCSWERVKCHRITHRVSQLSLSSRFFFDRRQYHFGDTSIPYPTLNLSLFLPFQDLKNLDISNNLIEDLQGFEKFSKLKKLEVLNLQGNSLNTRVLEPLSKITSLKTLYLGNNYIGDVSSSEVLEDFKKLCKLKKIELLDLENNYLASSNIGASFGCLTSLKTLNLRRNKLGTGTISTFEIFRGFCELKNLQEIDLRQNVIRGNIPICLKNLTSLRNLDLSYNQLSGNIPSALTSNMTYLRILDLSENQLIGSIPPSLFNLTSIEMVSLSNNQLEGATLITYYYNLKSQLKIIGLSNCSLNTSTKELATFLHSQRELRYIDLSHNNIHGKYPVWLVENNTKLEYLLLKNNSIDGHVYFAVHAPNLTWIDISKNQIEGYVQTNVGDNLPSVVYLNLSRNSFKGEIPTSLGNMVRLKWLDLSNNNFTGEIPECLALLQNLSSLFLSYNKLHGRISPLLFNITDINIVHLSNNKFTGFLSIPINTFVASRFYRVTIVDISQNNISGKLPTWIFNLTSIQSLVMVDNFFEGPIPFELCNLADLSFLDLSQNEFSGSMSFFPTCTHLRYLRLQGNKLSGSISPTILNNTYLTVINLNNNKLSGSIPSWLGSLQDLTVLLLKGNRLSGIVPHGLCKLKKILILDLSHNWLSGSIPACLSNMAFGKSGAFDLWAYYEDGTISENIFISITGFNIGQVELVEYYVRPQEAEIMTKGRSSSYKGNIINFMAGVDLSCNHFTGEIPHEFGALTAIRALNLSHNELTGSIPKSLSKLKQLESMDVSYNKLSGKIPSDLIDINFLSFFSVAYNNLSGRVPDMKAQFGTFSNTSYEGNLLLCGPPLTKQCGITTKTTGSDTVSFAGLTEKFEIDPISFIASSVTACIMSLLALVIVLYINPYWRRMWFDFIDACLSTIFPFWSESFYRVSNPFT